MPLDLEFFSCLSCGAMYRLSERPPGTKFACTGCNRSVTVPVPPRGSEDSTLSRNVTDLKKEIEEKKKAASFVVKTGKRKKPS